MSNIEFKIRFGALCDTIATQIRKQGLKFEKSTIKEFQKDADAVNRLKWADVISDKEASKVLSKIFTKIKSHVSRVNHLKNKSN